jgi:hypothetical protein
MTQAGNPTDFESFLTWEALTEILSYDPATGEFRWVKSGRLGWVGRLAGTVEQASGYRRIEILGRSFYASRLAFLYMKKRWPHSLIDHRNGNRSDDRWVNLREATRQENGANRKTRKDSKSGVNGVYQTPNGKWIARTRIGAVRHNLGVFCTIEEAKAARDAFDAQHLGEFQPVYLTNAQCPQPILRIPKVPPARLAAATRGIPSDFETFLTQEILIRLLSYDPATGGFVWRSNETNPRRIKIGQSACGSKNSGGYVSIQILGRKFVAHRLAWLYMTGRWPAKLIDHVNGDRADNRWANLRQVDHSQNGYNQCRSAAAASGIRGVYVRENGKFRAIAGRNNKRVDLGTFDRIEDAKQARDVFNEQVGEFMPRSSNRGVP